LRLKRHEVGTDTVQEGRQSSHVVLAAPRISPRLLAALARLDDETVPIAEISRRVGAEAERLGLPRPSYQRLRVLVHELRDERQPEPGYGEVLVDIALRNRPAAAIYDAPRPRRTERSK
jgi:hypothetical protein